MGSFTTVIYNRLTYLWVVLDDHGNELDSFVTEESAIEYARYH